jgi:hypothetical protein
VVGADGRAQGGNGQEGDARALERHAVGEGLRRQFRHARVEPRPYLGTVGKKQQEAVRRRRQRLRRHRVARAVQFQQQGGDGGGLPQGPRLVVVVAAAATATATAATVTATATATATATTVTATVECRRKG